ncbi:M48 family metalloprotease [Actinospica durhamensis]|uniref:M48 family metalloprotease n=1 Tax=Actinospica durhamensis TaxID=1508375 RepID=A0A941ETC6_9ACTN|nr:M48 family metallopeptidase [Actinospica durhamensis]MBR7836118.1 M48 family metalloprotease [Actinospica durhamensis]
MIVLKIGVRATAAVTLLIGFYALGIALLVAVVGLDGLMLDSSVPLFLLLGLPFTAAVSVLVGRVFRATLVLRGREMTGVEVLESEQPAIWSAVREAAAAAGTAPPDFLWIDSRLNAAVFEETRWLGLRAGSRHLVIGAPMLIALSPARLDAVLAHEFGHFAHHDTRLLPVIMRGRSGLASALQTAGFFTTTSVTSGRWLLYLQTLIVGIIRAYAVRFLKVTQKISRAQEYAADRISAELCGRDTAACVIAEIPAYHTAYRYFRTRFADAAKGLGLVPQPEALFAGFGHMLGEPRWQGVVEAERRSPSAQKLTPFDSHPPIPDRVSALRALPDDGRIQDASPARAVDLLDGAQTLLSAVARREPDHAEHRPVDWDTLVDAVARVRTRQDAGPLVDALYLIKGAPPTMADFFDQVETAGMEAVLYRLLTPAQTQYTRSTPSVALQIGANALAPALRAWITVELAEVGLVRWRHSWSTVVIRDPEAVPEQIGAALDALLDAEPTQAGPAAAALRTTLKNAGVPV